MIENEVKELTVYLDYNIFVEATKNESLLGVFSKLNETGKFVFPFTHVHIAEVNRINSSEEIQKHLETISKISTNRYLDFNENLQTYTIRPRNPFETFSCVNEVPREYVESISKLAAANLHASFPQMPTSCYKIEDLFAYFADLFRKSFPGLGMKINNLSREDAISYLNKEVFQNSLSEFHLKINQIVEPTIGAMSYDYFVSMLLTACGYKTPNKDLRKASGLLSDEMHIRFAAICPIVISMDENFKNKLRSRYSVNEKAVLDLNEGLGLLYKIIIN